MAWQDLSLLLPGKPKMKKSRKQPLDMFIYDATYKSYLPKFNIAPEKLPPL